MKQIVSKYFYPMLVTVLLILIVLLILMAPNIVEYALIFLSLALNVFSIRKINLLSKKLQRSKKHNNTPSDSTISKVGKDSEKQSEHINLNIDEIVEIVYQKIKECETLNKQEQAGTDNNIIQQYPEEPHSTLYASSINVKDNTFYEISVQPKDDTIFELDLQSDELAFFKVYPKSYPSVIKCPDFLAGCDYMYNSGSQDIQTEVKGEVRRQLDGKWKVIKKAKIKFI
jgi:hypothetical protein